MKGGTSDDRGVVRDTFLACALVGCLALPGFAAVGPAPEGGGSAFPARPLFGDTHLHTGWSFDAGTFGCRLTPSDAYRFARGEEIRASSGQPAKLSRPLDFLVVADHSENMGLFTDLLAGKPELLANRLGRRWYDLIRAGKGGEAAFEISFTLTNGLFPKDMVYTPATPAFRSAWQGEIKAAEEYNEPGRFTAFIGFEWTSNPDGNNLHRNVIFRGNGAQAGLVMPYVTGQPFGSENPEDLWTWMAATEKETGSEVLAIAHNGNLSNGTMFPMVEAFGKKIDKAYAETRARWEPLYETTQTKGTGEAHPSLSSNDEFADFELWDKGNLNASAVKTRKMLEFEYARSAFKNGLALEAKLGVSPYKFGLVGGSDAHTGLAAMEEDNFFGKTTLQEPGPERLTKTFARNPFTRWELGVFNWDGSGKRVSIPAWAAPTPRARWCS